MDSYKFEVEGYFGSIHGIDGIILEDENNKSNPRDMAESCLLEFIQFDDKFKVWKKVIKNDDLDGVIFKKVPQLAMALQKAMEAENTLQIELSFRKEKNGNLTVILNFPGLSIFGNCCLEFTLDKVDQDSMSTLKQQVFFLAGQLNTSKSREMKNFGEIETLNDKIKNIEDNLKESREMELKHKAEVDQMKRREESLYAQIEEMKLREGRLNEEVTQVRGNEVNLRNKVNRREVQAEEMVDRSQGIMTETQGNYDVDIGSEGVESDSPEQEVRKNRERQADLSDEQDTKKRLAEKQKKIWAVVEKKQKALKEARSNFDRGMAHWNKKSSRRYRSLPANHPDYVTDWDGIQKWQDKAIQLEKEIVSLRREYRDVQAQ